jgi:hypothetical protein
LIEYGIVIIITFMIISPILLPGYIAVTQRNGLQVTAIKDLKDDGQDVKIAGHIISNVSVPIYGYPQKDESGDTIWHFETFPSINVSDSSGSIEVDLKNWVRVFEGPSPSPNSTGNLGSEYRDGDSISIIGRADTSSQGQLKLRAEYIAKDSMSYGASIDLVIWFMVAMLFLGILLIIGGVMLSRKRIYLYRQSGLKIPSEEIALTTPDRSTGLPSSNDNIEWLKNDQRPHFLLVKNDVLICGSVLTIIIAFFIILSILSGLFCIGGLLFLIIIFPMVFIVVFSSAQIRIPSRVGFSDNGLHIDYEKPPVSRLQFSFLRWSDIIDISYPSESILESKRDFLTKGFKLKFKIRPAGNVYLSEITEELAEEILRRFRARSPDPEGLGKLARMKEMAKGLGLGGA